LPASHIFYSFILERRNLERMERSFFSSSSRATVVVLGGP
jgi:hypothetical protein